MHCLSRLRAHAVSLQADLDCDADALLDVDYDLFEDGTQFGRAQEVCLCGTDSGC